MNKSAADELHLAPVDGAGEGLAQVALDGAADLGRTQNSSRKGWNKTFLLWTS